MTEIVRQNACLAAYLWIRLEDSQPRSQSSVSRPADDSSYIGILARYSKVAASISCLHSRLDALYGPIAKANKLGHAIDADPLCAWGLFVSGRGHRGGRVSRRSIRVESASLRLALVARLFAFLY